jgi:hypothetical protein
METINENDILINNTLSNEKIINFQHHDEIFHMFEHNETLFTFNNDTTKVIVELEKSKLIDIYVKYHDDDDNYYIYEGKFDRSYFNLQQEYDIYEIYEIMYEIVNNITHDVVNHFVCDDDYHFKICQHGEDVMIKFYAKYSERVIIKFDIIMKRINDDVSDEDDVGDEDDDVSNGMQKIIMNTNRIREDITYIHRVNNKLNKDKLNKEISRHGYCKYICHCINTDINEGDAWLWENIPKEHLFKSGIINDNNMYRIDNKIINHGLEKCGVDILLENRRDTYTLIKCINKKEDVSLEDVGDLCFMVNSTDALSFNLTSRVYYTNDISDFLKEYANHTIKYIKKNFQV